MEENFNDILKKDVYYSYLSSSYSFPITSLVIGFERCRKTKGPIHSDKPCYVIHYVLSGSGYLKCNDKKIEIGPGEFFILPPHSKATYFPKREDPWSYIWLEFNGSMVKTLLDKTSYSDQNYVFKDDGSFTLKNALVEMIHRDNNLYDDAESLFVSSYLLRIFSFLLKKYPKNQKANISKREQTLIQIEKYLLAHYDNPNLSMEEVAKVFSFSQSYLTRLFKSEAGITPIQYVNELRMKRAIELLNLHSFTIDQIAEAVGYDNQFYFTKRFKKYYGIPPSKYRQKIEVDMDKD